jgi:hypothetical protein
VRERKKSKDDEIIAKKMKQKKDTQKTGNAQESGIEIRRGIKKNLYM